MYKSQMLKKEREIISEMQKIIRNSDLIRANTVRMARVCGNKNCKCAKGQKHVSLYASRSHKGKQRMHYIPKKLEKGVCTKIKRYRRLKSLLDKLLEINWKRLMEQKKA